MTAAIPDDIMQAASAVFQTEIKAGQSGGVFVLERIASALQSERNKATEAERERCAQIAEEPLLCLSCGYVGPWKECCDAMNFDAPTNKQIAAAIRNPTGE